MADRPRPGSWFHSRPDERTSTGRAIKVRRAELGLGRRDLADRAGISYPYLAEIENGKKQGSPAALGAIAEGLGLSLSELVERGEALAAAREESAGARRDRAAYRSRPVPNAPQREAMRRPPPVPERFEMAELNAGVSALRLDLPSPDSLADAVRAVLADAPPDVAAAALLDVIGEERIRAIVRDELRRAGVHDPSRD